MPRNSDPCSNYPWKNRFDPRILERGWDYYQDGAVSELTRSAAGYSAVVRGTEDYCVEIEMENGAVGYMDCDCPYAEDGNDCKHMAAVLYAIEDVKTGAASPVHTAKEHTKPVPEPIEAVIARIPETELRDFLIKLCRSDERIERQITLRYAKSVDDSRLEQLRREFEQICREYSDRHGFINWENASDFGIAVAGFLTENTGALVERGSPMPAFQMVCDTLLRVGRQAIDDDGDLSYIASVGYRCWMLILTAASPAEKRQLFDWFSRQIDGVDMPDYLEDAITEFYETEFQEPDFLRKRLEHFQPRGSIPSRENYREYYRFEHNAVESLRLMEKLSFPEAELQKRIQKFYSVPSVRRFAVDHALSHNDIESAIKLLREGKELDREYAGLVAEYSARLIELYERLNRKDEYKQELLYQLFHCSQNNLDYTKKLKAVCDEKEWAEQREKLLAAQACRFIRYSLLASEGLTERLLQDILRSGSIMTLDSYEKLLKKEFPEQLRDAYASFTRNGMASASNRNQYAGMIRYLKKLCHYLDGKPLAMRIASEWRAAYPRRRAMLDELSRSGF